RRARGEERATARSLDLSQPDLLADRHLLDPVLPAQSQGAAAHQRNPRGASGPDRGRSRRGAAAAPRSRGRPGRLRGKHRQGASRGAPDPDRGAKPAAGGGGRAPGRARPAARRPAGRGGTADRRGPESGARRARGGGDRRRPGGGGTARGHPGAPGRGAAGAQRRPAGGRLMLELWLLIALVILFLIIRKPVGRAVFGMLDAHAAKVRAELDEAKRLREEAQSLLAEHQRRLAAGEDQAKAIV